MEPTWAASSWQWPRLSQGCWQPSPKRCPSTGPSSLGGGSCRAGAAAATIALVPLPLADVIPLLAIQTGLVLSISRIYGFQITAARARELIVTFGVAMVARTLFQQLSKLGGVPGWLLSSAIATSTTVAIGYAAMTWFSHDERPSRDAFRKQTTEISLYLRGRLADLGRRKPNEGTLKQRVTQALQDMPPRTPAKRANDRSRMMRE